MENQKITTWLSLSKKQYSNYYVVGLLALMILVTFGYMQLGWFSTPQYLAVVTAEEGVTMGVQDENGCFTLILKDADNAVWFTDRPQRDAGIASINDLVDIWPEAFGDNPPNADLQLFDENGEDVNMVLVLESTPVWNSYGHTLAFDKVCPIFSSETDSENVSDKTFVKAVLFVDDFLGIGKAFTALGDAISHETKHSTTQIAKKINFGNWEEHAAGYATGVVTTSAEIGANAGGESGGREGEIIGSRIGAELGIVVVKTTAQVALGKDVDGTPDIDPHDFYIAIKEAVEAAADNLNLAYGITDYVLNAQRDTIRANFFDSLNEISIESGKDTFCGEPITDDNALFDAFMYYLRFEIESRIYNDLQDGMSVAETLLDVTNNLTDDIEVSLLRALWELQYYCIFDEDDLYTHLFVQIYVVQYVATLDEWPELGGVVVDGVAVPTESVSGIARVPLQGPSGVEYISTEQYFNALDNYYLEKNGPEWERFDTGGFTVAETYGPLLTAQAEESLASLDTPLPGITSLESNPATRLRYEEFQEMFTLTPSIKDVATRDSASFGGIDSPFGQLPEITDNPYATTNLFGSSETIVEESGESADFILKPVYENVAESVFDYEAVAPKPGILDALPETSTRIVSYIKSTFSNFTHNTKSSMSIKIEADFNALSAPGFSYYSNQSVGTLRDTSSETSIELTSSDSNIVARFEYVDEAVVTEIIESSVETALEEAGIDIAETL